jgi:hypothetical protein
MIRISPFVLVLGLAAASWADGDEKGDDKAKPPAPAPAPESKPEPAPEAPAAPPAAETEPPVKGTRYQITLRTGATLTGVVTCDKVFERRDGIVWGPADKDAPGAGIRLYFVKDADGFVFVPTREMKDAEKLETVSEREGRDLVKHRIAAAQRAGDEREKLRKEREKHEAQAKAEEAEKAADESKAATDHVPTPEEQLARYTALLKKYPPGKWTLDTPKDIERRRIVMDLFPNDEEKAFLAVYDEWSRAFTAWKAGQDALKASEDAAKPAAEEPAKQTDHMDGAKK